MINEVINELKKFRSGKKNTERIEISIPALDRIIFALEQVSVLDKIRAEVERIEISGQINEHSAFIRSGENVKTMVLDIIDKYRVESEEV